MPSDRAELIICGLTTAGRKFRPSDWAERLCGVFAAVGPGNRTRYSPYVFPVVRDGVACVIVKRDLEQADPMAFNFLMNFARDNDLQLVGGREEPRG